MKSWQPLQMVGLSNVPCNTVSLRTRPSLDSARTFGLVTADPNGHYPRPLALPELGPTRIDFMTTRRTLAKRAECVATIHR